MQVLAAGASTVLLLLLLQKHTATHLPQSRCQGAQPSAPSALVPVPLPYLG
jgi:hypothetical protein